MGATPDPFMQIMNSGPNPFETQPAAPPPETPPAAAPAAVAVPETPPAPDPVQAELAAVRSELARMRTHNSELEQTARYWSETARTVQAPPAEPPAPAVPAVEPEEFAADLSRRGPAALQPHFVSRAEHERAMRDMEERITSSAQQAVQQTTGMLSFDARMAREFPDLQDQNSQFYQDTLTQARTMAQVDPALKNTNGLLYSAALVVKSRTEAAAAVTARTTEQQQQAEQQRLAAVAAQTGPTGGTAGVPPTGGPTVQPMSALTKMFMDEVGGGSTEAEHQALRNGTYVPQSRRAK